LRVPVVARNLLPRGIAPPNWAAERKDGDVMRNLPLRVVDGDQSS
jgi:hypothetical protein